MANPDPSPSTRFASRNQAARKPDAPPEGHLHVRVPMATKGRWVAAARRAGLSLSAWVVGRLDKASQE